MPSLFARALRGAFLCLACSAATAAQAHEPLDVVTVVKVMPLPWFSRMAQGVMVHDAALGGGRAHLLGPAKAEPALQAALIQKLLQTEPLPKALAIVPTDPQSVEALARQADARKDVFTVMPVALAERAIQAGCKPGGTVLDPFSGSGTTGLAAARHGRKYVGIDLNAEYLDLSLRTRLAQTSLLDGEPA